MRGREFACGYMESGTKTVGASTTKNGAKKKGPTADSRKNNARGRQTQHATVLTSYVPLVRRRFFCPAAGGAGAAQYLSKRRSIVSLVLRWACG